MYKVIKKNDWKTSQWAGGTTNEIFIYPSEANYAERKFKARISIANTNTPEKSKFTSLPGVDRFISKLEGKMFLEHYKHYDIELDDFQIDRFKGEWETYSTGQFKDFNLMLKGMRGDLYFREINENTRLHLEHDSTLVFLFLVEGDITVNTVRLEKEDFFSTNCEILEIQTNEKNNKIFYGFIKEWD